MWRKYDFKRQEFKRIFVTGKVAAITVNTTESLLIAAQTCFHRNCLTIIYNDSIHVVPVCADFFF